VRGQFAGPVGDGLLFAGPVGDGLFFCLASFDVVVVVVVLGLVHPVVLLRQLFLLVTASLFLIVWEQQ
jgi:hypothetical protein